MNAFDWLPVCLLLAVVVSLVQMLLGLILEQDLAGALIEHRLRPCQLNIAVVAAKRLVRVLVVGAVRKLGEDTLGIHRRIVAVD